MRIEIDKTWDGRAATPDERATVELSAAPGGLQFEIDAPWHGDPPPAHPVGSTPGLWDHEVVELFLLGRDERYLEIEVGPHGHHLGIRLEGVRQPVESGLPLACRVERQEARWRGTVTLPERWLPPGLERYNAYAIHGVGAARRYLAAHAPGGEQPDFHRLGAFAALPPALRVV